VSWAASAAADSRLLHFDITPGLAMKAGGSGTTDPIRMLSTAGYVGLPFEWWRGDMEVMVEPFGTSMHRGTL